MITRQRIILIQEKIKRSIKRIEKEENVQITFGHSLMGYSNYTVNMKVNSNLTIQEKKNREEELSRLVGFTQNVCGMKFKRPEKDGSYTITEIRPRNRKYPVIAISSKGDLYKFKVDSVKTYLGGDKIVNRNVNLDNLLN